MKLKHLWFLLITIGSAEAFVRPFLCLEKLEPVQAVERIAWASKCRIEPFKTDGHGLKFIKGYPIFAFVEDSFEVSNPNNWFAPTDRNAACDVPDGYRILGICIID